MTFSKSFTELLSEYTKTTNKMPPNDIVFVFLIYSYGDLIKKSKDVNFKIFNVFLFKWTSFKQIIVFQCIF